MKRTISFSVVAGVAVLGVAGFSRQMRQQDRKFELPPGFVAEEVIGPEIGSPVAMTFDSKGQLVVAKGGGDIVTLIPDGRGGYEQRVFTDKVRNSQGLLFDGPDLLVAGVGPSGVGNYRVYDSNGDSRGDRVEEIGSSNTSRGIEDHGIHNMSWGPDGYVYWATGNATDQYEEFSPLSPVRLLEESEVVPHYASGWPEKRRPGGKFYRRNLARYPLLPGSSATSPDTSRWELFAAGFRNVYDGAFNLEGEFFTFDSDMEPDLPYPHYRNTRLDHVVPGGEFGYREGGAIHQEWFFDDLPQMENQGRGSPTGVYVLQTYNYPKEYWDYALFADWSRGRVVGSRLTKTGATYTAKSSNFVFATPLNISDMEVGPDGNLYFTLGGRNTTGAVYRIVYKGTDAMQKPAASTPLERVLTMQQPRSAYSRQAARDTKAQMGERGWQTQLTAVVRNAQAAPDRRVRALELLQVFGPAPDEALLGSLAADASTQVRAAATYYLGMHATDGARGLLLARLNDPDAFVQRRAIEALLRTGVNPTLSLPVDPATSLLPLLGSDDRFVRFQARTLIEQSDLNRWKEQALRLPQGTQAYEALLALVQASRNMDMINYGRIVNRELELLKANPSDAQLLSLVRLMEYTKTKDKGANIAVANSATRVMGNAGFGGGGAGGPGGQGGGAGGAGGGAGAGGPAGGQPGGGAGAGGAGGGGAPGAPGGAAGAAGAAGGGGGGFGGGALVWNEIGKLLVTRFPSSDWRLDRELGRMLAVLQPAGALDKLVAEVKKPTNVPTGQFESALKQQMHMADMAANFRAGWDDAAIETMTAFFVQGARDRTVTGGFATAWRSDFLGNIPDAKATLALNQINAASPQVAALPGGGGGPGGGAAGPMNDEQEQVLIFNPASFTGNAAAGALAFQKAGCIACHTFGSIGTAVGPDLTTAGQRYNRRDLVTAIHHPSADINEQYRAVAVTRTNGQTVLGIPGGESASGITLKLAGGAEVTIPTSEIRSRQPSNVSLMPEGLLNILTNAERINLLLMLEKGPSVIPDSLVARLNGR